MRRSEVCFALVTVLLFARAGVSHAQGYGVYEQGACTMGRGGTAAARPCADASGMYFNPAGIAGLPLGGSIGGALIWPGTKWRNDNTQIDASFLSKTYAVPNFYFVAPVAQRYALGFGVYVPYGLTTEWDGETFEGRFLGYKTSLKAIYLQPTAAAQFGKLKIGAGLDITYLSLNLQRKLDLSSQLLPAAAGAPPGTTFGSLGVPYGTDFADAVIDGSAWGIGYNLGATYDLTPQVSLGVRYLGTTEHHGRRRHGGIHPGSHGPGAHWRQPARASRRYAGRRAIGPAVRDGRTAGHARASPPRSGSRTSWSWVSP